MSKHPGPWTMREGYILDGDLDTVADQLHRWLTNSERFPEPRPVGRIESECPISSALARGQRYDP